MKTLQALTRGRGESGGYFLRSGEDSEFSVPAEDDSLDGLAVSEEEYWDRYYNYCEGNCDRSYEWNNGYLEERPVGDFQSSVMYRWFLHLLECYFSTYPAGIIANIEIGFRLALPHGTVIRKPDLGVVLHGNPVAAKPLDRNFKGIYDLCVESLSYSTREDIVRDTVQKKTEYARAGVKEYHILDARGMETAFYRLNARGTYSKIKPGKDGVLRSQVLPGFQFRISDLYTQPALEKLSEDPVYQDYVLPFYQKARHEAESQRLRAEQEKLRAEEERVRAEAEKHRADQSEKRFFEAARNMLANGLELERIMRYTGLSAEELGKLSESVL